MLSVKAESLQVIILRFLELEFSGMENYILLWIRVIILKSKGLSQNIDFLVVNRVISMCISV